MIAESNSFLDAIGAGSQGAAARVLVSRILNGTGRINVGQGAVMTVQGSGAVLSPAIGGRIAQRHGYGAACIALGLLAVGAIVIWVAGAFWPAASRTSRLKGLARPKAQRVT